MRESLPGVVTRAAGRGTAGWRWWVVGCLLVTATVLLGGVALAQLRSSGPGYAFRHTQPGTAKPITFDPCRPVEYVVYDVHAPIGTEGVLDSAIREISRASGLKFVYRGPAESPFLRRPSNDGLTREPVVVGWARPQDVERLTDRTAGLADSHYAWNAERGEFEYVSGTVILNTAAAAEMLERVDGRKYVRALVMHELGHVLGLDHVGDRKQLMYDDNIGQTRLGAGDRVGLAAVGASRCKASR